MASKRIQGITIVIDGETGPLQNALKKVDTELRKTQGNLKDINKLLKLDPGNTELLVQKQKNLQESIKAIEERLKTLKATQTDSLSPEEYDNLQREIIDTEQHLEGLQDEYREFGSVAQQKIAAAGQAMQDMGGKIADAGRKMQEIGGIIPGELKKIGSAINEHVLQPMLQVAKVVGAAGFAATTALTKGAVDAASEYEQLSGGIVKLYGDAAGKVAKNAQKAYKTAGQSANDYMKTVTSFSASLISSLGGNTQKAAKIADMAIRDMSDNANTFGTDFQTIEGVYKALAKEQYNTLDNLSLGYAGTKAGMEQLIRDAERMDETFKVTHKTVKKGKEVNDELAYSYADVIQAIHIVQDNMHIAGTTTNEASKTIEGSMNAMKASWQNLLTAIGTGGDVKEATKNALEAAGTYLIDNLFPTIQQSLSGIEEVWQYVIDRVIFHLPEITKTVTEWLKKLPDVIKENFIDYLPWLLESVKIAVSQLLWDISGELSKWFGDGSTTSEIFTGLQTSFDNIVGALETIGGALSRLWTETLEPYLKNELKTFIEDTLPKLTGIISSIADGISGLIDWFNGLDPEIKNTILDVAKAILVGSLAISTIGSVIKKGGELISNIGSIVSVLGAGPGGLIAAIALAAFWVYEHWEDIKDAFEKAKVWISERIDAIKDAFETAKVWIIERFDAISSALDTAIKDAGEWFAGLGKDIRSVWDEYFQPVVDWLGEKFNGAIEAIQPALEGITKFLTDVFTGNWEGAWNSIVNLFGKVFGKIGDKMKEPINAVIDGLNWMIDKVEGAINSVISGINNHLKIDVDFGKVPDWVPDFMGGGRSLGGIHWGANLSTVNWGRIDKLMANGGILGEGQRAIVGEHAPEYLRVVNGRAIVTPMTNQPARMGGDTNVSITINAQPGQSAEDIAAAVKRVFIREMQQREAAYA